jgi:hypothetical protein
MEEALERAGAGPAIDQVNLLNLASYIEVNFRIRLPKQSLDLRANISRYFENISDPCWVYRLTCPQDLGSQTSF